MPTGPWNRGRFVGPRNAFTMREVRQLKARLVRETSPHDLCLFMLAIDTMLRCSDLLALRVRDIADGRGCVRASFGLRQKKTGNGVQPVLTPKTRGICQRWIDVSGKREHDFLFTRDKAPGETAISSSHYRALVKSWAAEIDLDPADYSTHSLRRTKPIYLFRRGVRIEDIAQLLGHRSPQTTLLYLGLTMAHAQAEALRHDMFGRPQPGDTSAVDRSL